VDRAAQQPPEGVELGEWIISQIIATGGYMAAPIVFGSTEATEQLKSDKALAFLESRSHERADADYWIAVDDMPRDQRKLATALVRKGAWEFSSELCAYRPGEAIRAEWEHEAADHA
jgi:hypothetical protein